MKRAAGVLVLILLFVSGFGQNMWVKKPNLSGFSWAAKRVTPVLDTMSSLAAKQHPEYGILPFNAQCRECVELIDKRTVDTRFFVDPYVPGHTFTQKSYFPLHYKNSADDIWRTIDPRLEPDTTNPGVYAANRQPVPTKCDLNQKITSIKIGGLEFEFNKNLTLYYTDSDTNAMSKAEPGNYSNHTAGQQGLNVQNMWPGIDMQQVFSNGEVKTSYVIQKQLPLLVDKGYMVVEDHFTLPEGYTFEESNFGERMPNGGFRGNYNLKDKKGNTLLVYTRATYIDFAGVGLHGIYHLTKNGNDYTLKTLIPINWLNREENVYPLTIDPLVVAVGDSIWGNYTASGLPRANLAFTTVALGSCDYHMTVPVLGDNTLTNVLVDIEYKLTYSDSCGNPPEPSPFCLFTQVRQTLVADRCNSINTFGCQSIGDTTGTCTTDSFTNAQNVFRAESPIAFSAAQVLNCYTPQCPNYEIPFTLKNTDSICGDVCGYLCARGSKWAITVEGCYVNGSMSQDKTVVCAGQSATFSAVGNCGVPPYHYVWTPDGGNTFDTIYGSTNYVVNTSDTISSPITVAVACYIVDSCGALASTGPLYLSIVPIPLANAGPDVNFCRGGTAIIGGNPTTNNGATTVWTGSSPTVQNWLSTNTGPNPQINVPFGTIDTFFYALRTDNQGCPNTDTMFVYSVNGGTVTIDSESSTHVCVGQTAKLAAVGGPFLSYRWNNGTADSTINAPAGPYFVVVKDTSGCLDTSNIITITTIGLPTLAVYPDTIIEQGDSVLLYSNVNLGLSIIDSFEWYPPSHISCTTCPFPYASPLADQTYSLTIYSEGCSISASALIEVLLPDNFFIPNVFTPNGDGNNDLFYIDFQRGVTVLQFQVFDRWGEKVHDGLYPWDGSYRGKPAPEGVYVYVFKLELSGQNLALMRKGSVTLLR
jgi:gliding motility-associated-like protein